MPEDKVKIDSSLITTNTQFFKKLEEAINKPSERCQMHEKRLDNFETGMKITDGKVDKVLEQNITIFKFMEKMDKVMFVGNGKPGVITRIEMVEDKHDEHIKQGKDDKNDKKFNITSLISILAVVVMVILSIWTVLKSEARQQNDVRQFKSELLKTVEELKYREHPSIK